MSKPPTKSLLNEQCETLGFKHRKTHRILMKALQQTSKLAERNAVILRRCIARIAENAEILEESNRLRKLRADILEDFKLFQKESAEISESFNYYRNFPTYIESNTSGMENASTECEQTFFKSTFFPHLVSVVWRKAPINQGFFIHAKFRKSANIYDYLVCAFSNQCMAV